MMRAVLITGGNSGDAASYLRRARQMIAERVGRIVAESAVAVSAPWGEVDGWREGEKADDFLNQVLVVETAMAPEELLDAVQAIENELGRERNGDEAGRKRAMRYSSRTMDIDILLYGGEVIRTPRLTVPHLMMTRREFVLRPLCEVAAQEVHPVEGKTMRELLDELTSGRN